MLAFLHVIEIAFWYSRLVSWILCASVYRYKANIFSGCLEGENFFFRHFVVRSPYWGTCFGGQMRNQFLCICIFRQMNWWLY